MRILIAGIAGGIVMFLWGAVSHTALPVGEMGLKPAPNEQALIAAMQSSIREPGLYFIPGRDMDREMTAEEQTAWAEKVEQGPNALVLYHPAGRPMMSMRQFAVELGSNIAAALLVGLLMTWTAAGFGKRVIMAALIGLTGWLSINVSHWNWYGFPAAFEIAELIDQFAGWLLSGLVIAFILRNRTLI